METTVELVHLAILKDAAQIANDRYALEFDVAPSAQWRRGRFRPENRNTVAFGTLFRPDMVQSRKGGLCLSVDPHIVAGMDGEEVARIHQIGRESLKQSLVQNKRAFVGLILGEARQGRNYFDRYDMPTQLRLL